MKTIGLLGGLTYISTIEYYKRINEKINAQLGKSNSAKIIINSINYPANKLKKGGKRKTKGRR